MIETGILPRIGNAKSWFSTESSLLHLWRFGADNGECWTRKRPAANLDNCIGESGMKSISWMPNPEFDDGVVRKDYLLL